MELAFGTKSLRDICESEVHAKSELGPRVAEILKHRLADLRAAASPKDIVVGLLREVDNEGRRHMVVDLCDGYRIVFSANHANNPTTKTGDLDWARVSRIKILRIETGA